MRAIVAIVGGLAVSAFLFACGGGGGGTSTTPPPLSPPAAPSGVAGTAGDSQAMIHWNAVPGATGYEVERATVASGPYAAIATTTAATYADTGLANGTTYFYVVYATNSAGQSAISASIALTPEATVQVPGVPSGLVASAQDAQVNLTWTAVGGATSYAVFRAATSGGPYTAIATPTNTSYNDAGLANGTTYFYVVAAIDASGSSANSAEASATPAPVLTAPLPPAGVSAAAGSASVTVSWTASSGATGYTVQRAFSSGGPYSAVATPTASPYVDSGLANGTPYYYVVVASNAAGSSANSAEVTATPVAQVSIPPVPMALGAIPGNGQVALTWNASVGASGYRLQRATAKSGPYSTIASPAATNYPDTGVTNGTTYYYVVAASNAAGTSANSAAVAATPMAPVVAPAAPGALTALPGNGIITLTWTESVAVSSFHVKRATTSAGPFVQIAAPPASPYMDKAVTAGTKYFYVVSALNGKAESANSSPASATAQPLVVPPSTPTNFLATPGVNQVALSWFPVQAATSYVVQRGTSSAGPFSTIQTVTSPASTYVDAGLVDILPYYYTVIAVNAAGESPATIPVTGTPVLPGNVTGLSVVAAPGGFPVEASMLVAWNPVAGAQRYTVGRTWSGQTGSGYQVIGQPVSTSFLDTGLVPGNTYSYVVSPGDALAAGGLAAPVAATATPYDGTKSAPVGVTANGTPGGISLAWGPAAGASRYVIARSSAAAGPYIPMGASAVSTYVDVTALPNQTYYYTVTAYFANTSYGLPSAVASAVAQAGTTPPPAPTGLLAVPGYRKVALTWNSSPGASSYSVQRATSFAGPYSEIATTVNSFYPDTGVAGSLSSTLSNGQTYFYRVQAMTGSLAGATSLVAGATPGANGVGSAASQLAADATHAVVMYFEGWYGPTAHHLTGQEGIQPLLQSTDMVPFGGGYDAADPAVIAQQATWLEYAGTDAITIDLTNNAICYLDTDTVVPSTSIQPGCSPALAKVTSQIFGNSVALFGAYHQLGTPLKIIPLLGAQSPDYLAYWNSTTYTTSPTATQTNGLLAQLAYVDAYMSQYPAQTVSYQGKPLVELFIGANPNIGNMTWTRILPLLAADPLGQKYTFRLVTGALDSLSNLFAANTNNDHRTGPSQLLTAYPWWEYKSDGSEPYCTSPFCPYYLTYVLSGTGAENVTATVANSGRTVNKLWGGVTATNTTIDMLPYSNDTALRYALDGTSAYTMLNRSIDFAIALKPTFLSLHQFNEFAPHNNSALNGDEGHDANTFNDLEPSNVWGTASLDAARSAVARFHGAVP